MKLDAIDQLVWVPTSRRTYEYELRSGEKVLGTFVLNRSAGYMETDAGSWRIERDVTRTIGVRDVPTQSIVARVAKARLTGQRDIRLGDRSLVWRPSNFWRTRWGFYLDGILVVEARRGRGIIRFPVTITFHPSPLSKGEETVLSAVSLFIMVTSARESEDASAGAIGGIISH